MAIMFIPKVVCAKCDCVVAAIFRVHKSNERYVEARCHGMTERVEFSPEDGKVVTLWAESQSSN